MYCFKCGAQNPDEEIFCTACGAFLTGVSLDDPQTELTELLPEAPAVAAPRAAHYEPPVAESAAEHSQPAEQQPAAGRGVRRTAQTQPARRRKKRNPQGLELVPVIAAGVSLICLFLPWFGLSILGHSNSTSLFSYLMDLLKDLGSLGFLEFVCIAFYLVIIAAPVMVAWFAWKRENNYMGVSALAFVGAILAQIFTCISMKNALSGLIKASYSMGIGFFLYLLAIAAAIGGGVMIVLQRQKTPRRPRTR